MTCWAGHGRVVLCLLACAALLACSGVARRKKSDAKHSRGTEMARSVDGCDGFRLMLGNEKKKSRNKLNLKLALFFKINV